MSNNNILTLVKQHTQHYIEQYNEIKEKFDNLTIRHDELKTAYQDLERDHNVLVKEKEETITELNTYFNVKPSTKEIQKEEEPTAFPLFTFTPSSHIINTLKNSPTFQKKHKLFNKRSQFRRYKMNNDDSDSEDMKSYSTPNLTSNNENTEVLKKILTDDMNMPTTNLRDASFSFNNMKPYIFTLDKNNKKN
jgi:hypothetical protein